MSKHTIAYAWAMIFSVVLISLDTHGIVEFGGFTVGIALLVVTFAVLTIRSIMQDRKSANG